MLIAIGIVLAPFRATAGTVPALLVSFALIRTTPTTQLGASASSRPETQSACSNINDVALVGYDGRSSLRARAGAGHAYEELEQAEQRALRAAAATYVPAAAGIAAEGVEAAAVGKAEGLVANGRNYINSTRVIERAAAEPGPYHNFPGSFDQVILEQGEQRNRTGIDAVRDRCPGVAVGGWKDIGPSGGRSGSRSSRRAVSQRRSPGVTA